MIVKDLFNWFFLFAFCDFRWKS